MAATILLQLEDETRSNFEVGPTVVEGSQTTMSSLKFEENTDVFVHMTVVTTDDTSNEQRDILQVKKNQTGVLADEDDQSSGDIDKFGEPNDKLFEAEQLMVVQNSNNPTSDAPNSLFSSGDPDNEIPPLNANEGEIDTLPIDHKHKNLNLTTVTTFMTLQILIMNLIHLINLIPTCHHTLSWRKLMIKITMSNMVIYIAQKDKKCVHYKSLIFLGMIATIVASLL